MGLILKVIPLKLFLDMEPSSSEDVTRALRGCFRGRFVHISLILFQSEGKPPVSVFNVEMAWPWFRALDLKSVGGPWFKSSTLPLSGFVLGSPEFNSSTALCN